MEVEGIVCGRAWGIEIVLGFGEIVNVEGKKVEGGEVGEVGEGVFVGYCVRR